jgi:hypothetical protein
MVVKLIFFLNKFDFIQNIMVYVKVERSNYLSIKTKTNAQLGKKIKKLDNKKLDNGQ